MLAALLLSTGRLADRWGRKRLFMIGVLVFVGLTAWDTQKIKEGYDEAHGAEVLAKGAIMGALSLYLDFINLFMMLLRLFGNRN